MQAVAATVLFNPESTLRALLELHPVNESKELLVVLVFVVHYVALACYALMPISLAIEAVLLQAFGAVESVLALIILVHEGIRAVGRWTPAYVRLNIGCLRKSPLIVLFKVLLG